MLSRTLRKTTVRLLVTLCFLTLAVPAPVAAACRKEILVYLDISGSMNPLVRDPKSSPFARTVDSLGELFAQRDLVQDDDVVTLRLFGERIEGRETTRGRSDIRAMIQALKANKRDSNLSNIVEVIEDIAGELADGDSAFDRRLVIIASDFVHEHELKKSASTYIDHWNEGLERLGDSAKSALVGTEKRVFLFLTLPSYTPTLASVRTAVLDTLTTNNSDAEVDFESATPSKVAAEIKRRLLFPPQATSRIKNGGSPELIVNISNPNCQAVDLAEVKVRCKAGGDAIPLPLSPDPFELAAAGQKGATETFTQALSQIDCDIGDEIEIFTRLEGGPSDTTTGQVANRLVVKPFGDLASIAGVAENRIFKDSLYLYLQLKGQYLEPETYEFSLKRDDRNVAMGTFELPADLSEDWQIYLLPLRAASFAEDQIEIELEVDEATVEQSTIRIRKDKFESTFNWAFFLLCLAMALFASYGGISQKQRAVFRSASQQLLTWGALLITPLSVMAYDWFRSNPSLTPWFKEARWLGLVLPFAAAAFLWLRQRRLHEIDQQIDDLFKTQGRASDSGSEEPNLNAVQDVVRRVGSIADRGASGLQILRWAGVLGLVIAGLVYLTLSLARPAPPVTSQPAGVLKVTQR